MGALVLWEVSRKQNYIFCSNKLKENVGASIIIENAVEKMPFQIDRKYSENLIYNGGGGSLYKFNDRNEAEEFVKKVSAKVIKEYPGLEVFMVIEEYDDTTDPIIEVIDKAYVKLAQKKNRRKTSGGLLSFGIERKCEATGQPAVYPDDDEGRTRYISREIKVKQKASDERSEKFDKLLPQKNGEPYKSIREFSELVKGDKKYIAVVHIDGNRMGRKFSELKKHYSDNHEKGCSKNNAEYLENLKRFSEEIKNAYEDAFRYMTGKVLEHEDDLKDDILIKENKFPVIPLIVAGDDVTYITNGKIGIETARIFIEYLNTREICLYGDIKINLNACAGVAIVRYNYPFFKAYELAEDLCSNAKKRLSKDYGDNGKDFSLIDWHIEQGDLMGSIEVIRKNNYTSEDNKKLYMRPIYINNTKKWNNYSNFKRAWYYISEMKIDEKGIARNKLKGLLRVLRMGEKSTEIFLKSNRIENYFPPLEGAKGDYCFDEDNCMYYDALEVMDLFINLSKTEVR